MKRVFMSIHGIESDGKWQDHLAPIVSNHKGLVYRPIKYGKFPTSKFLWPLARKRQVQWFRDQYTEVCSQEGVSRPSIVAHSFGSYLVASALETYPEMKFDKIILVGSIVRTGYDWKERFERGQVNAVMNEYGEKDIWAGLVRFFVTRTGPSGRKGFKSNHPRLSQSRLAFFEHDTFPYKLHFRNWLLLLDLLTLSDRDAARIRDVDLDILTQAVANRLQVDRSNVRANIFWPTSDDTLEIVGGLCVNMSKPEELTLSIAVGTGCVGKAYEGCNLVIALFVRNWGDYTVASSELKKLHPGLQWIVSLPIPDPDGHLPALGILSVDGLHDIVTRSKLEAVADNDIRAVAQKVGMRLRDFC